MKLDIKALDGETLVARFVELAIEQGIANETFKSSRFNRLYDKVAEVVRELRSRPEDERRRLFALYDHPNLQVRYNAVVWTFALNPEGAVTVLQDSAASKRFPWAGDAGMSIAALEMGISKLPEDPWL